MSDDKWTPPKSLMPGDKVMIDLVGVSAALRGRLIHMGLHGVTFEMQNGVSFVPWNSLQAVSRRDD